MAASNGRLAFRPGGRGGIGWLLARANPAPALLVCRIPASYKEAVDENIVNGRRILEMAASSPSTFDEADEATIFYAMLASSRRYHEGIHDQLPDCARPFNQEYTAMLAALQDLTALKLAQAARPETARLETRYGQAQVHAGSQWEAMIESLRLANLEADS